MLNELSLIQLIDKTHSDRPYCDCGRSTMIIYRDGAMWLECAIVGEPIESRIHRLWNAVSAPGHVHRMIVEVPAPGAVAA